VVTFDGEIANAGSGGTTTIDWNSGQKQYITLTANTTVAFTPPTVGVGNFRLKIIQGGAGGFTITWPTQGTTAGDFAWINQTQITLSTAPGAIDVIAPYWNASFWEVSYGNNFG
jgi:hypothetical protein